MRRTTILFSSLSLSLITFTTSSAQDEVPLTPAIGVAPTHLDFGCVEIGTCGRRGVALFNSGDSGTILRVTGLTVAGGGFRLVDPPAPPFNVPPNVALTLEFCPPSAGPATGTLTIESDNAPNSPVDLTMEGHGNQPPVADPGGPYSGEARIAVQFDGTASTDADGSILAYLWNFGDGGVATGPLPTHTYDAGGRYTVTLEVVDDCSSWSEGETIADIAPPTAPLIGVDPLELDYGDCIPVGDCLERTINLFNDNPDPLIILTVTDLAVSGDGFSLVSPPTTPLEIPGGGSLIPLTLRFCASFSGRHAGALTITAPDALNSPLEVPLAGSGNLLPICDAGGPHAAPFGTPIQFDGTASADADGEILSYDWDFGDGQSGTGPMPVHTYNTAGHFTVVLVVADDCGGTSECETSVDIGTFAIPWIGVEPAALNFGVCNPIGECAELDIELFNAGADSLSILTVTELTVSGDAFSLTSPPNLPLEIPAGGGRITLTIRFCPTAPAWYTGTLTITAPDAFNSPVDVPLAGAGPVGGGRNPHATLPLHALLSASAPCDGYLPMDCQMIRPTVNVPPETDIVAFLLVDNHNELAGVQTAFAWHPSWQLLGSHWDCQPGQVSQVPREPGGATAGRLTTVFDCVTSLELAVIGRMFMRTGSQGCLTQVAPASPCGIHVLDCDFGVNEIDPREPRLGAICVESGGLDACDVTISVEPTTWGAIKHSFRRPE